MNLPILSPEEIKVRLAQKSYPAQGAYLAMYSSWLGGIVTDPGLMIVPVDDHIVHRGDGVFEAIKVVDGKVFLLTEHLQRLELSAAEIGLKPPHSFDEMKHIIELTLRAAKSRNAVLRLFISRGPGTFSPNPYDSVGAQMYLIVTELKALPEEKYLKGVKIGRSQISVKEPWLAKIKTCNYLPNVMMKKESVDRGLDFTVGFDGQGYLAEGSTENIVMVDAHGTLVRPFLRQILRGTTMMRTFELAEALRSSGVISAIAEKNISEVDLKSAREIMMIGTTLDVLPVTEYEGQKVGSGSVGPVAQALLQLLRQDMKTGPKTFLMV